MPEQEPFHAWPVTTSAMSRAVRLRILVQDQLREDFLQRAARHQLRRLATESSATTPPRCSTMTRRRAVPPLPGCASCRGSPCRAARVRGPDAQHQRGGDVEARLWLVENQHVGIVEQRRDEQHLLLHPFEYAAIL